MFNPRGILYINLTGPWAVDNKRNAALIEPGSRVVHMYQPNNRFDRNAIQVLLITNQHTNNRPKYNTQPVEHAIGNWNIPTGYCAVQVGHVPKDFTAKIPLIYQQFPEVEFRVSEVDDTKHETNRFIYISPARVGTDGNIHPITMSSFTSEIRAGIIDHTSE
jgi:hypothetical protein